MVGRANLRYVDFYKKASQETRLLMELLKIITKVNFKTEYRRRNPLVVRCFALERCSVLGAAEIARRR